MGKEPQGQENDAWMKREGPVPFLYPQFLAEPASIQCRLKQPPVVEVWGCRCGPRLTVEESEL